MGQKDVEDAQGRTACSSRKRCAGSTNSTAGISKRKAEEEEQKKGEEEGEGKEEEEKNKIHSMYLGVCRTQ